MSAFTEKELEGITELIEKYFAKPDVKLKSDILFWDWIWKDGNGVPPDLIIRYSVELIEKKEPNNLVYFYFDTDREKAFEFYNHFEKLETNTVTP